MRTNGVLQYDMSIGGGYDEGGNPIPLDESWSEDVPCLIRNVTNNSRGRYEDGKFNQTSYDVLVESGQMPLTSTRVRLVRNSVPIGEFPIQGIPELTSMDRIKFSV